MFLSREKATARQKTRKAAKNKTTLSIRRKHHQSQSGNVGDETQCECPAGEGSGVKAITQSSSQPRTTPQGGIPPRGAEESLKEVKK